MESTHQPVLHRVALLHAEPFATTLAPTHTLEPLVSLLHDALPGGPPVQAAIHFCPPTCLPTTRSGENICHGGAEARAALHTALARLPCPPAAIHHVLGASLADRGSGKTLSLLPMRTSARLVTERLLYFYEFAPKDGWRLVMLDTAVRTRPNKAKAREEDARLEQKEWLRVLLECAAEGREAVVLIGHNAVLPAHLQSVVDTEAGRKVVVAYMHAEAQATVTAATTQKSNTEAQEKEDDATVAVVAAAAVATAPSPPTVPTFHEFPRRIHIPQSVTGASPTATVLDLLPGGDMVLHAITASANGNSRRRLSRPLASQIYAGPIENDLVGAFFLYPYYQSKSKRAPVIYKYHVMAYNSSNRLYVCREQRHANDATPPEQLTQTFRQISSCQVSPLARWFCGKENDKLAHVARVLSETLDHGNGPKIGVAELIAANKLYYPGLKRLLLLKEGCHLVAPLSRPGWTYPTRLHHLSLTRPTMPPALPSLDSWVQCDVCSKWRIIPGDSPILAVIADDDGSLFACAQAGRDCREPEDQDPDNLTDNLVVSEETASGAGAAENDAAASATSSVAGVSKKHQRNYEEEADALALPDPSNPNELSWSPLAIFARERKEELHAQIRLAALSSSNDTSHPPTNDRTPGDNLPSKTKPLAIPAAIPCGSTAMCGTLHDAT